MLTIKYINLNKTINKQDDIQYINIKVGLRMVKDLP